MLGGGGGRGGRGRDGEPKARTPHKDVGKKCINARPAPGAAAKACFKKKQMIHMTTLVVFARRKRFTVNLQKFHALREESRTHVQILVRVS